MCSSISSRRGLLGPVALAWALSACGPVERVGFSVPDEGNVRILVEPGAGMGPLLDAISSATRSVHVTMYLVTSDEFIEALVERHRAGVEVAVVLNESFPSHAPQNTRAYERLRASGVAVRYASRRFAFTHAKCVIVDARVAWIMTMNATRTSSTENRELLVIDERPGDVARAEAVFASDFDEASTSDAAPVSARSSAGDPMYGLGASPDGPLVLAPDHARVALLELVDGARSSVLAEVETLSDPLVVAALVAARQRGLAVEIVLPSATRRSSLEARALERLRSADVRVVARASPYIHAKAIVVDGARAYVGSANLSTNSLTRNREIGVLLDDPAAVRAVSAPLRADVSAGLPQ